MGKNLKLKAARAAMDMTQQELAELVDVSSRTIISLEKGQYNPSLMLAYRISLVFETTVEDLYCLQENKELEERKKEREQFLPVLQAAAGAFSQECWLIWL